MCPVTGLTSVISKFHLLSSSSPPLLPPLSSVAVRHLFHIPAIKILHGFQCLVAVGYEAEEQASFRRFNPDQKAYLLLYYSSSPLPPLKKYQNNQVYTMQESLTVWFVACCRNPVRLVFKFGLVSCKDWTDLIWSVFSENGTAADALPEAPIYNPVLPLVLKLS